MPTTLESAAQSVVRLQVEPSTTLAGVRRYSARCTDARKSIYLTAQGRVHDKARPPSQFATWLSSSRWPSGSRKKHLTT